ncbi:hypothetical protein GWN42_22120 [candidate division KSB1 bacterium]|nr:hypothetical protein [Phycisphaerae bacterium]NIU10866.1 hypothetical protein [Phycisphaerae bacterium]NIV95413.1 hypothetical protein [candidate division KSB1 bacterium]
MKGEVVSRWLGVGANFGVLLGLILLWTEINQNKQMTRVELGAEQLSFAQQNWLARTDEPLATAIYTATYEPHQLTKQQVVILDSNMKSSMASAVRVGYLVNMGVFELDLDSAVWTAVRHAFGNEFAHAWFSENKDFVPPNIAAVIDRRLGEIPPERDRQTLDRIHMSLGTSSQ